MSLAALLCPEDQIARVADSLNLIVEENVGLHGISPSAEIHCAAILGRTDGWENLPDKDSAIEVVEAVVDALCSIPSCQFVMRGIDVTKQKARKYPKLWSPRRLGIQHVLEKCDEWLGNPDSLMVIVDDMAKPEEHRQLLSLYREEGTPGFRKSKLRSIVDNIYFMPSHYSRGIQAADVLAYIHRRHFTLTQNTDPRAVEVSKRLWSKLFESAKVRSYGIWPG